MTAQQTRGSAGGPPDKPAASCPNCLAWGVLYGGLLPRLLRLPAAAPRAACAVCAGTCR